MTTNSPDQPRTGVEAVDAIEAVFVAFRCFIGGNDHPLLNVPTNALRLAHAEEELAALRTRLEEAEAREREVEQLLRRVLTKPIAASEARAVFAEAERLLAAMSTPSKEQDHE